MPNPALIPTFIRELLVSRTLPREPEPSLVMDDPEQVAAYSEAGRIDGVMAAAYLFHSARVCQVIKGCRTVIDIGCGPATQLAQIAQLNPSIDFHGVDLSPDMLESARIHSKELGLENVKFSQGDMTNLDSIPDNSADAVISTMALHHLPTQQHLRACFGEIRRIMLENAGCYLVDFTRLKSLKSVLFFAYMNRRHQPHLFSLDYERSLRAAFQDDEFEILCNEELPPHVSIYRTFKVPFLAIIKSEDKELDADTKERLKSMRRALKPKYRRDLDDLRLFFRLGGLRNDPFR